MKKIICAISVLVVSAVTNVSLSSFTFQMDASSKVCSDVSCKGKHCSYTVGCDCSGFVPKNNGDKCEKAYCKRCVIIEDTISSK